MKVSSYKKTGIFLWAKNNKAVPLDKYWLNNPANKSCNQSKRIESILDSISIICQRSTSCIQVYQNDNVNIILISYFIIVYSRPTET